MVMSNEVKRRIKKQIETRKDLWKEFKELQRRFENLENIINNPIIYSTEQIKSWEVREINPFNGDLFLWVQKIKDYQKEALPWQIKAANELKK